MTVVYVDTLFLLNALIDYLLLLAAARLAGEPLARLRFALGATVGGGYAVALVLPGGAFLALTCALGGGVVAIGLLGGDGLALGERGIFYSPLDLKMVLLSAAICYVVLAAVFQNAGKHSSLTGELRQLILVLDGREISLPALVDTGNTLTDPITGRPVVVAEGEALTALFPRDLRPTRHDMEDPAEGMARLGSRRFRLLPYRAVGVERGLLLALRVDRAVLGGRELGPTVVALSPTVVSDGGGYRALVGATD